MSTRRPSTHIDLLGVKVDALTMDDLHRAIGHAIRLGERWVIPNHNMHSVYIYHHDARMADFYAHALHVHIDGMPLVIAARLLGHRVNSGHRVTYVDWIYPLMQEATRQGWRIFYLGSKLGVAAKAADRLRREFSGLEIRARDGYFDARPGSTDNADVLREIAAFGPHILMVGMGMPRQEHWVLDHLDEIDANVILTSGACMDYVAGAVSTPPRWLGPIGLEWIHRLITEPRRLWRRYLLEPWFVIRLLVRDLVRRRH